MSDSTAPTRAADSPPVALTREELDAMMKRITHASVCHPSQLGRLAGVDLALAIRFGIEPAYGDLGRRYAGDSLRKAIAALPIKKGCCDVPR